MSAARTRELSSSVRLPEPGQDATPFMLRCCVKRPPFRGLHEFEGPYARQDEFKIYVWRSATLRDVANLLHIRDPHLSSPLALHTFRLVHFEQGQYRARHVGSGVTRLSSAALHAAIDDVLDGIEVKKGEDGAPADGDRDAQMAEPSSSSSSGAISAVYHQVLQRVQPKYPREAEEAAARQTLDDIGVNDGHILDVVIREPRPQHAGDGAAATGGRRGGASGRGSGSRAAFDDRSIVPSAAIPPELHPWNVGGDRGPPLRRADRDVPRQRSGDFTDGDAWHRDEGDSRSRDRERSRSPRR